MPGISCFSDTEMQAYLLGQLPQRVSQAVFSHLEICVECQARADRFDGLTDSVIRSLRRGHSPFGIDDNTRSAIELAASTGSPTGSPAEVATGSSLRVAGYEVLEELGRGGMSVVYKARQGRPGRLVALKMILAEVHAGAERRTRFLAEADAIARLQHPGIVHIYEVGQHNGLPFLALEFLGGGNLAELTRGQPQPPHQAAALVEKLAQAMDYAHRQGVVHRDLKPANVLLTEEGQPKVTDFGLAKQERPELTATGDVLGTPSYMAPEQAVGDNRAVGPAADVYALGAILYELLTGRPPFQGLTLLDTLAQVRGQEPVSPSRLQAGEPIVARPVGWAERTVKWARRRPALAAAYGLLALAMILGAGGGLAVLLWQQAEGARSREQSLRQRAENAEGKAQEDNRLLTATNGSLTQANGRVEKLLEELERSRYGDTINLAQREWEAGQVTIAGQMVEECNPKYRAWEWDYLSRVVHPELAVCTGHRGPIRHVAFSPDGRMLASASEDQTMRLWDATSGKLLATLTGHDSQVWYVAFSPDGKTLASAGEDALLWDATSGKLLATLTGQNHVEHVAFSPDGKTLASAGARDVRLWDTASGKPLATLTGQGGTIMEVAFSPDGKILASAGGPDKRARLWEAAAAVAGLAVLRSNVLADNAALVPLVETVTGKGRPAVGPVGDTLGAALYRAGRHAEAVKRLEEVKGGSVEGQLFLAMAYHRLGAAARASQGLNAAKTGVLPSLWQERARWKLLRAEAEAEALLSEPRK